MAKARLRLVEPTPEPERFGDYRDCLRANRRSLEWKIETTDKRPGDLVLTGAGFVRQP